MSPRAGLLRFGAVVGLLTLAAALGGCGGDSGTSPEDLARSASAAIASLSAAAGETSSESSDTGGDVTSPASDDPAGSDVPDLCTLLPTEEASALVGVTYSGSEPTANDDYHSCQYTNDAMTSTVSVSNLVVSYRTAEGCWEALQQDATLGASTLVPVSGVGDEAVGYQNGLIVRTGSACVEVASGTVAESNDDYGVDVQIAQKVIDGVG